ncbi:MAG: transglycosylase domain-containing protein, partial [Solirubrobacterales bacterium]
MGQGQLLDRPGEVDLGGSFDPDRGPSVVGAVRGGLRALIRNVESGQISEGASTITMQLMRNLYIANPDRSVERKIVEARMAIDYETE